MTDKNPLTDKLQAGRELDMLVAEKIMGWRRTGDDDHTKPLHTTERRYLTGKEEPEEVRPFDDWGSKGPHPRLEGPVDEDGQTPVYYLCACRDNYDGHGMSRIKVDLPAYSTEMDKAWQVLEKLSDQLLWKFVAQMESGIWKCLMRNKENTFRSLAESDTAPHAVCLCALRFLAAQEEQNLNPINKQA